MAGGTTPPWDDRTKHQYLLPITDTDIQWDEENFRELTGMELGAREKKVPGLLWIILVP